MATWDLENAAHLLRRAAFGGSPDAVQDFFDSHSSVAEAVDDLLSFNPSKRTPPKPNDTEADSKLKMQRWWIKTMLKAGPRDATREKLVLFYHNFLVSGADKQPILRYMAIQNGMFRLLGKGSFKDLIREFNRDPANLYYLDGILNDARNDDGVVVANTEEELPGAVCVPAGALAPARAVNLVMLGAVAAVLGEPELEHLVAAAREVLGKKADPARLSAALAAGHYAAEEALCPV